MPVRKNGVTVIGTNYKIGATASPETSPPPVPMCTSKICTVKQPHEEKPYTKTTKGLPKIIGTMEAKKEKNGYDIRTMDLFYSVHWDHENRPLPAPLRECVDKECPVKDRHEEKHFSKNPKKANLLPKIIQWCNARGDKLTWGERGALDEFWRIHGPKDAVSDGKST